MTETRWVQRLEDNWRVRVNKQDVIGRLDEGVFGPHRWNDPVEVELADNQVGPFRQMLVELEGTEQVTIGRVQGRWV